MTDLTVVVAQDKARACLLAKQLGVDRRYAFSARHPDRFEGIRTSHVVIEAGAFVPPIFMSTIRATLLKMPGGGRIEYVTLD